MIVIVIGDVPVLIEVLDICWKMMNGSVIDDFRPYSHKESVGIMKEHKVQSPGSLQRLQ